MPRTKIGNVGNRQRHGGGEKLRVQLGRLERDNGTPIMAHKVDGHFFVGHNLQDPRFYVSSDIRHLVFCIRALRRRFVTSQERSNEQHFLFAIVGLDQRQNFVVRLVVVWETMEKEDHPIEVAKVGDSRLRMGAVGREQAITVLEGDGRHL